MPPGLATQRIRGGEEVHRSEVQGTVTQAFALSAAVCPASRSTRSYTVSYKVCAGGHAPLALHTLMDVHSHKSARLPWANVLLCWVSCVEESSSRHITALDTLSLLDASVIVAV